jgi:plasmid stability protein
MKEQVTTRLDAPLRQRLRIFVAVSGRTAEDVIGEALSAYLPSAAEMVQVAGAAAVNTTA